MLTCNPGEEPAAYELLGSVASGVNEFTDQSIELFPYGGGLVGCEGLFRSLSYKIESVDNTTARTGDRKEHIGAIWASERTCDRIPAQQ